MWKEYDSISNEYKCRVNEEVHTLLPALSSLDCNTIKQRKKKKKRERWGRRWSMKLKLWWIIFVTPASSHNSLLPKIVIIFSLQLGLRFSISLITHYFLRVNYSETPSYIFTPLLMALQLLYLAAENSMILLRNLRI